MLAAYGAVAGYLFGFLPNLSFWPFSVDPASSIAYRPRLSFLEQWHRYLLVDATTSLGWDTGRAVTNVVAILLYLVTRSLDPTGTGQARWATRWQPALNAFAITFGDRFPGAETY